MACLPPVCYISDMERIKSSSSKQVIRLDPEILIHWSCPSCGHRHKKIYRMPLLQKDMGYVEVRCAKCRKRVEVSFRPSGNIYK